MILRKFLPILCAALALSTGCGGSSGTPTSSSSTVNVPFSQTDITVGTGRQAAAGNLVTANYSGWLYDAAATDNKGRFFDGGTIPFRLGVGAVIKGWDQGVPGMAVGGKRRLVIPPSLAYGCAGAGGGIIPPNATLVFDIELVNVAD